jgi:hypothetical protein
MSSAGPPPARGSGRESVERAREVEQRFGELSTGADRAVDVGAGSAFLELDAADLHGVTHAVHTPDIRLI